MSEIKSPTQEGQTSTLIRGSVTGFEQGVAALAGLFTAGPLGALASWAAIRGVQGKWTPWFILGIPSAIAINGFYLGVFYAYTSIANRPTANSELHQSSTPAASPPQAVSTISKSIHSSPEFYDAGIAVGGQRVQVDLASIRQVPNRRDTEFIYYLGNERVSSIANCAEGTWTTFPEGTTHKPKSSATQNMIDRVCTGSNASTSSPTISASGAAIVFDPPSNIRTTPNGTILCSVTSRGSIPIQGREGDWYRTDYCGQIGYIHKGQVKF